MSPQAPGRMHENTHTSTTRIILRRTRYVLKNIVPLSLNAEGTSELEKKVCAAAVFGVPTARSIQTLRTIPEYPGVYTFSLSPQSSPAGRTSSSPPLERQASTSPQLSGTAQHNDGGRREEDAKVHTLHNINDSYVDCLKYNNTVPPPGAQGVQAVCLITVPGTAAVGTPRNYVGSH